MTLVIDRGKMNKWVRLKNLIREADVIIEILDIRDAQGTRLPLAEEWAGPKRLIILANKADLLTKGERPELPKHAILTSAKATVGMHRNAIIQAILMKATERPVKVLFVGYPNVGKSSIINMLAKRKAARVSPVAGTTRDVQWVHISDDILATDYRGLFPESETREGLVRKAAINASGNDECYAYQFAERVLERPKLRAWFEKKYDVKLDNAKTSEDVLNAVAERRKYRLKGNQLNIGDAARSILRAMKEAPEI